MNDEKTLLKKGWRSDALWTSPVLHFSYLLRIPLYFDIQALLASQYWPRQRLEKLQHARLADILQHAGKLPYWQAYLSGVNEKNALQSLRNVPLMTKDAIIEKSPAEYTDLSIRPYWPDHTSGSTAKPFQFLHDMRYSLRSLAICDRMFRAAGGEQRYPVISMRVRQRPGVLRSFDTYFYMRGFNGVRHRLPAFEQLSTTYQDGVVVQGFTSMVVELARLIEERGTSHSIRGVIATGEGISDEQRAQVERIFGVKLFMGYTTRELGWLGFECADRRLHLNEEWAYIEILDSAGKPLPDGAEGRVVVTTFDNRVMPFIRYMTGDLGTIESAPCPCGRTLKTLRLVGRTAHLIEQGDLTTSLLEVAASFDRFYRAVRNYQIVQKGPRAFVMRIVPGAAFDAQRDTIHAALLRVLHPESMITWETVDTLPETAGGKAVYYVRDFA